MTEKNTSTLVKDIYSVLSSGAKLSDEQAGTFGSMMASMIQSRLAEREPRKELSLSMLGTKCDRQLWYKINKPELAEPLPPNTRLKFLYGDMVELLALFLAEVAGHKVEARGKEVELNGVKGHIDCSIDGMLVDVKSASGFGFAKFKEHKLRDTDPFGYLSQLGSYLASTQDDPVVVVKGEGGFLAIDKEKGDLTLDSYRFKDHDKWAKLVEEKKEMLKGPIPKRAFEDKDMGLGGNRKLGTECSYCSFKKECWPDLKTYLYSTGPVYLTVEMKKPRVVEF